MTKQPIRGEERSATDAGVAAVRQLLPTKFVDPTATIPGDATTTRQPGDKAHETHNLGVAACFCFTLAAPLLAANPPAADAATEPPAARMTISVALLGYGPLRGRLWLCRELDGAIKLPGVQAARGGNRRCSARRRRSASPQHPSSHRLPYPCQRWRGRSRRGLLEDSDWSVHFLVVDTKNWSTGKKVLISPRSAQ